MCIRDSHFAHRYAKRHESTKDHFIWHAGVLLEWDHCRYATVIELAWWGGIGGYAGKSNWVRDRDSPRPAIYSAMPACLKAPWRSDLAEVRAVDVDYASDRGGFEAFLGEFTGTRFLKPEVVASADVRLTARTKREISRALLNYVQHDTHYSEASRNCQTFAADFYSLLVGVDEKTTAAVNQIAYTRHVDWFLYDPA